MPRRLINLDFDQLNFFDRQSIADSTVSSKPCLGASDDKILFGYGKTGSISDDAIDVAHGAEQGLSLRVLLVCPIQMLFMLWVELMPTVEARANCAVENLSFVKDGCFVRSLDKSF